MDHYDKGYSIQQTKMASQDTKMCECGCVVEERSRDTGEWWDYCNDCYEKDQEEEEERPLCRNCEIETRKHCDDCGGYGSHSEEESEEEEENEKPKKRLVIVPSFTI
jgi:hypothetical protein